MKSAYELAMSRLEKQSPQPKVGEATKKRLAEIDSEITAKIAERKVFLEGEIAKLAADPAGAGELHSQLAREIARLEEERETKKEKARKQG